MINQLGLCPYYAWLNRKPSAHKQRNHELSKKIKSIFDDEKGRAGAPRITRRLNNDGESVGKQRVAKIMRENGWRAKAAKKFKATTNSNHHLPVAPNLLQQNFLAYKPNEKWVSDITYCWTEEGWLSRVNYDCRLTTIIFAGALPHKNLNY